MKRLIYRHPLFYTLLFLFQFFLATAQNLVNNGDFEQGDGSIAIGFSSDYTLILPTGNTSVRQFGIGTNPQLFNTSSFISMGDHTTGTGKMMIVDGINNNGNPEPFFWRVNNSGEICGLQTGVTYTFSYWIKSIYNSSIPNASVANIGIKWNNVQGQSGQGFLNPVSGSPFAPAPGAAWQKVTYQFIPTNACVRIEMFNWNGSLAGNDFAIDDIELLPPVQPLTLSFSPNNISCPGANDGFIAAYGKGGVKPYTYLLTGGVTLNNTTGIFQNLSPGNYNISVRDANGTVTTPVAVTLTQAAGGLTITGAPTGTFCSGQSIALTASGAPAGASYTWTVPPSTTPVSSNASLNAIVTNTTTYQVTSSSSIPIPSRDLINNGNFSSGNADFYTDYRFFSAGSGGVQRAYGITQSAFAFYTGFSFCALARGGTGNMMVFDGSTIANDKVWCQKVPVKAGETYTFTYHVQSLVDRAGNKPSANLEVQINGVPLSSATNPQLAPQFACSWEPRTYTWNSGTNTVADICIFNRVLNDNGNDFALDDISFTSPPSTTTCTPSASVTITPSASCCSVSAGTTTNACTNAALSAPITHTTSGATGIGAATGLPTGVTAAWVPASNSISISGTPTVTGTFNYTIPVTGATCTGINATGIIIVKPKPIATASSNGSVCVGSTLSLTATSSIAGASFAWSGPGYTSTTQNPTVSTAATTAMSGTYSVTATANGCSSNSATTSVTVNTSVSPTVTCLSSNNSSVTFGWNPLSGATGYDATYTINGGTPIPAPAITAPYTINGLSPNDEVFLTVTPLGGTCFSAGTNGPTACKAVACTTPNPGTITGNASICIGGTTTLSSIGGDPGGSWTSLNPNIASVDASGVVTGVAAGTAKIKYEVSSGTPGAICTASATFNVIVTAGTTLTAPSNSSVFVCIDSLMEEVTFVTTGASGIAGDGDASGVNGLPPGVSANFLNDVITLRGTPTLTGVFTYSIPVNSGCGSLNAGGTITVEALRTVTVGSGATELCINDPVGVNITHSTTVATGIASDGIAGKNGLPPGVSASWASDVITISGIATEPGEYKYSIPLLGGCGNAAAEGTIKINKLMGAEAPSGLFTVCYNGGVSLNIRHKVFGGVSGLGVVSGLPPGVNANLNRPDSTIIVSGIPLKVGSYDYTIELLGGCADANSFAKGKIVVTDLMTVGAAQDIPVLICEQQSLTNAIRHATTNATGIGVPTGLPAGLEASYSLGEVLISGTPSVFGTFSYEIPLIGGCGDVKAKGTITIEEGLSVELKAPIVNPCVNTLMQEIRYTTKGARGLNNKGGLPLGVNPELDAVSGELVISGTPLQPGKFIYEIEVVGRCGTQTIKDTIEVKDILTVGAASVTLPEACIGNALPDWYHVTDLAASIGTPTGLPLGVTVQLRGDTVWLSGTPLAAPDVYSYSIPVNGRCGGTAFATGTIELRDVSLLPVVTGDPYVYCVDEVPSGPLEATGLNVLWYDQAVGGVGSPTAPLPVTIIPFDYTYYVTQREAGKCESNRLPVAVTIVPPPTVNAGPDKRIEEGQSVVLNGTALPSTSGGSVTISWTPTATLTNATTARPTARPSET
ncbi:MAG: Ig-like domain-containing protein, partial [Bacteroidetes bacterium]|nr:Ig-like domain-containing protein [Bacteroidota bacterium]